MGRNPTEGMKEDDTQDREVKETRHEGGFPFGRFDHALDPKKRLTIPALWRELLGNPEHLYVLLDPYESCLTILSEKEMRIRMARLSAGSLFDKNRSAAMRYVGENSELLNVDGHGRIRISDRLMRLVGLREKVVFIGTGVKMELWPLELKPLEEKVDRAALQASFMAIDF